MLKTNPVVNMTSPTNFSLIKNYEEVIVFLHDLYNNIANISKIHICMKNTEFITCDSFMYLLALLRNSAEHQIPFDIDINRPIKEQPRKYLDASGLLEFAESQQTSIDNNTIAIHR